MAKLLSGTRIYGNASIDTNLYVTTSTYSVLGAAGFANAATVTTLSANGNITVAAITSNGSITATTVGAATIGNTGATLTGTLNTAAQTGITSLGTLTGLTLSGTLNGTTLQAATIGNTGATLTGTLSTAAQTNITSVGNLTAAGITVSARAAPNANASIDLGTSGLYWNNGYINSLNCPTITGGTFSGTSTTAKYADLAERYLPDTDYAVGTVVSVGGEKEVTASKHGDLAIGVISADPAFRMNEDLEGGVYIALKGRVPVLVIGPVQKGQRLVAFNDGTAIASTISTYDVFAVALETNPQEQVKLVEAVIL
jgi:hypothetical protein